jgi:DNA-binding response OmpR family regulator
MSPEKSSDANNLIVSPWEVEEREQHGNAVFVRPPSSYRQAFGDKPIRVGIIEFQILLFLASRPYHAFTSREIANALNLTGLSISPEVVDGHVAALRDQLGVLHDFVQTVPHVGYRYKA